MKKLIVFILALILLFVGFRYWEKSNKLNSPQIQTSMNKNSIDDKSASNTEMKQPCFDAAIGALAQIEIIKQGSIT